MEPSLDSYQSDFIYFFLLSHSMDSKDYPQQMGHRLGPHIPIGSIQRYELA